MQGVCLTVFDRACVCFNTDTWMCVCVSLGVSLWLLLCLFVCARRCVCVGLCECLGVSGVMCDHMMLGTHTDT